MCGGDCMSVFAWGSPAGYDAWKTGFTEHDEACDCYECRMARMDDEYDDEDLYLMREGRRAD
jgi:hypothetical protein